jgi:ABC-2 type transport system ATP-binding protein
VGVVRDGRLVTVATIAELRGRARHRIEFHTEGAADPEVFRRVPGVQSAVARDGVIEVLVEGSVDRVIKAAAAFNVVRVSTPGDDLFMAFYHEDEK